uniref:Uncharacterized protein n=1 Tax=Anguilla anguilla TaxID=7936 RepID=A0A0E9U3I6_ANGAN
MKRRGLQIYQIF